MISPVREPLKKKQISEPNSQKFESPSSKVEEQLL